MSRVLPILPQTAALPRRTRTLACLAALAIAGCGAEYEIQRYQAPKTPAVSAAAGTTSASETDGPDRMIAAIVPQGEVTWFFKLSGPHSAVATQEKTLRDLLASLKFADGKPSWTLPAGWIEKPGTEFRFATLVCGAPADASSADSVDSPLEVSVTSLPTAGDEREYLLANVNRWRGQLQLGPLSLGQLDQKCEKLTAGDAAVTLVDFRGSLGGGGGMGTGPFARGGSTGPMALPVAKPNSPAAAAGKASFGSPPQGWQPGELVVSRQGITLRHEAAYQIEKDGKKVEITVDRMPAGGGLAANVNRWRGQIGLSPVDPAELAKQTKQVEIGGAAADYVELLGEQETIFGAVAERGGEAWYFKLKGASDLAEAEKENFEAWIKAAKLE